MTLILSGFDFIDLRLWYSIEEDVKSLHQCISAIEIDSYHGSKVSLQISSLCSWTITENQDS